MSEAINHPPHYGGDTTYEAIKVIEAWELGFALGNSVKYLCRAGKKTGEEPVKDLKKAAWYLQRRLIQLEPLPLESKPNLKRHSWEHIFINGCDEKCGSCNLCCLSVCSRCNLYEGGLTTHCPGMSVDFDTSQRIYNGKLNYRGGSWVCELSEHTPAFHRHQSKEACTCPVPKVGLIINGKITCANCHLSQREPEYVGGFRVCECDVPDPFPVGAIQPTCQKCKRTISIQMKDGVQ